MARNKNQQVQSEAEVGVLRAVHKIKINGKYVEPGTKLFGLSAEQYDALLEKEAAEVIGDEGDAIVDLSGGESDGLEAE